MSVNRQQRVVSVIVALASAFSTGVARAGAPTTQPTIDEQDLFTNGGDGHANYRIPGIVTTAKGTLLVYCEGRKNGKNDYGEIDTQMRRSTDGGRTWSPAATIAHNAPRIEGNPRDMVNGAHDQTVNNPVAIADADGTVHFLYCVNYEHTFYMRSDDDGATFSKPVELTRVIDAFRPEVPWFVVATGPSHGIQLKSGRLIVPIWLSVGGRGKHGPSVTATIYSDDHGKTWTRGAVAIPATPLADSVGEPTVVELSDGRVMMNARNSSKDNRRIISISPDGISNWSAPHLDEALWEPNCAAGITHVPSVPGTLVFSNPQSLKLDDAGKPLPGATGKRVNLSVKVSRDDGQSWTSNRTLEAGSSAYSDLTALPDGTIACFYEAAGKLTLARFNLAWAMQK